MPQDSRSADVTQRREALRALAGELMPLPTVSFSEHRVRDYIEAFARSNGLSYELDAAGNASVTYRRGRRRRPFVIEAHMDHPGFVVTSVRGRRVQLEFRGGLSADYGPGEHVRFVGAREGGDIIGHGTLTAIRAAGTPAMRRLRAATAELDDRLDLRRGDIAVWDVADFRMRGDIIHARACDDLAGCVAALAALQRAAERGQPGHLVGLFTRAEEVGLLGAAAAARQGTIADDAIVIALETSSMAGGRAEQGGGPIIRVGDRGHIFNAMVTRWMAEIAGELAVDEPGFRFQRKLMDGGTTEATAFDLMGYETGAACVALGNYHNAGGRGRVRAETVHIGDLDGLAELMLRMMEDVPRYARRSQASRRRWQQIGSDALRELKATKSAL